MAGLLTDAGLLKLCGLTAAGNGLFDVVARQAAHEFYFEKGVPYNEAYMMWTAFGRVAVGAITLYLSTPDTPPAAKTRLLRVLGGVLLMAGGSHAYNAWIGLQKGVVALMWGGGSVLLGVLCLRRGWRRSGRGADAKAE